MFATPGSLVTFRLPNRLVAHVQVSDRFHLKPLLRSVTFPQVAFVLALAQGSVRLLEVGPEIGSFELQVADLPADVAGASGMASIADRASARRAAGLRGQKVRMRQYCRQIDHALRPLLAGLDVPLILATTEPLDGIDRSVNTYPHLAARSVAGSPESASSSDLVSGARAVLDEVHASELEGVRETYDRRSSEGRTAQDVVDEIARRAWLHGGRVLAVRREDVPGGGSAAAILRYAV